MLSLEDQELRTLSKKANERIRRLENWMDKSGVAYNQALDVAKFMLEGKTRFKERITDKMTQAEKDEQLYAVTAFLNNPLSLLREAKRQQNLKEAIEQEIVQQLKTENRRQRKRKEQQAEKKLTAADYAEIEVQAILPSLPDADKPDMSKRKEKQFWRIFDKAKEIFRDKTFDYKTLAKAITWRLYQGKGTTRDITRAMLKVVKDQSLNRRKLFDAIGRA